MENLKTHLGLVKTEICTRQDDLQAKFDNVRGESKQHLQDELRGVRERLDGLRASFDTKSKTSLRRSTIQRLGSTKTQ